MVASILAIIVPSLAVIVAAAAVVSASGLASGFTANFAWVDIEYVGPA